MSRPRFAVKAVLVAASALSLACVLTSPARAQDKDKDTLRLSVTAADKAAVAEATNVFRAAQPVRSANSKTTKRDGLLTSRPSHKKDSDDFSFSIPPIRFPGDVTFSGGNVIDTAQFHAVYLLPSTCTIATCWGNPEGFLKALGHSDLIHVADQYTGVFSPGRYTLGFDATLAFTPSSTPLTDADIQAVVLAAAEASGDNGYGHIFDIFLPPGQDECFDATFTTCYSPDNLNAFAFCAYHSSFDVTGVGHLVYTVEPFQNVPGCQVRTGTPNGQLIDSTNSTLSHETMESITDPDGTAWFNLADSGLLGEEIADECDFVVFTSTSSIFGFGDPFIYNIGDQLFATQPEYSNELHACTVTNHLF